jgi:predicted short-subunit dehydrogenase-like oxidoreductase (DUF2520 family)
MMARLVKPAAQKEQSVAIVGVGNCGSTLAWAMHDAGFPVPELIVHRAATAEQKKLAQDLPAKLVRFQSWRATAAEVVWICVGDDAIDNTAHDIANQFGANARGQIFLHTSAGHSFRELGPLKKLGAAIGSAHPARSFPAPMRVSLAGTYFAIEGDAAARKAASAMVKRMAGIGFLLRTNDKAMYHACCVLSSGLLVAHMAAAEAMAAAAGVPKSVAPQLIAKLAGGSFGNWQQRGAAKSFTGPAARGNIETVRAQLASVNAMPELDAIYRSLTEFGVRHLPAQKRAEMLALLGDKPAAGKR